jgi:putative selenate reductase
MMEKDKFFCTDVDVLLKWILSDIEERNEIFGIPRGIFFEPAASDPFRMRRYGQMLETPLGVAAGPHTQLAQNIIAAWLCGARYIELKTIQVLDELEVTKPCIDMTDEGYNCEWSQELKLDQSFNEYLNAFILIYILRDKLGWGSSHEPGFIFNMSAGYNLEGIKSPTVQQFFDHMSDCSAELAEKIERIAAFYPRVKELSIPGTMSNNITVSTMHGCPPEEVEKIGRYFVEERGFHTTIKLNPTLLGAERLRNILNHRLGFKTEVPDEAFEHDLKYDDGVALIGAMLDAAHDKGVAFSLKLTNTLETSNIEQNLPKNESMIYMSGRALHPISINLAARLQEQFKGVLDISFSAGVDYLNIVDTLSCGLRPVTVCSDVLKPGGYGRLSQYLERIAGAMKNAGANSLQSLILARANIESDAAARLANLKTYAADVVENGCYAKEKFPFENIKTRRNLPRFDCAGAPCVSACSTRQDIPRYLEFTAKGDFENAYKIILATNPFPNVQGMVCDHLCQYKCTRLNYDSPLMIREIKRFIAQNQAKGLALTPAPANGRKVAIIGAGPTGLSCAYFLALEGFEVDIYETKEFAGGMAADGIPLFRLDDGSLSRDIDAIIALGVRLHTGVRIDKQAFEDLRGSHDYVYIAVGAQKSIELGVPGEDAAGVIDQLSFLSAVRQGQKPDLGKKVAVVGGGNSAIDVARTAKRLLGENGEVSIVYRRTREEMPSDPEEVQAAIDEGIKLNELTQPECMLIEEGRVKSNVCFKMELGEKDASGRPRPIKIDGSEFELNVDTVITAIGQRVVLDFLPGGALTVDRDSMETQLGGLFAGGDAIRGASSLVNAIGDGRRAAKSIMKKVELEPKFRLAPEDRRRPDLTDLGIRQARRVFGPIMPELGPQERLNFELYVKTLSEADAMDEASRCLQCDLVCNVCVSVCPNRANVALHAEPVSYPLQCAVKKGDDSVVETLGKVEISQSYQIVNIADFCNECGNCDTFCPTSGAPYKDKFKMHLTRASLEAYGEGFHLAGPGRMEAMFDGEPATLTASDGMFLYQDSEAQVVLSADTLEARKVELNNETNSKELSQAVETAVLYKLVSSRLPFADG